MYYLFSFHFYIDCEFQMYWRYWCFFSFRFCRLFIPEVVLCLLWLVCESVWRVSLIFDAYYRVTRIWKSFLFADLVVSYVTVVGVFTILILSLSVSIPVYRWFAFDGDDEYRLRFKFPPLLVTCYSLIIKYFIMMTEVNVLGINGISSVVGALNDDGCSWDDNYFASMVVKSNMVFLWCKIILFHHEKGIVWELRFWSVGVYIVHASVV